MLAKLKSSETGCYKNPVGAGERGGAGGRRRTMKDGEKDGVEVVLKGEALEHAHEPRAEPAALCPRRDLQLVAVAKGSLKNEGQGV